jgi:hypothetical protein
VTFKNVSPAIVLQFNSIRDFLPPNSIIESVLFPLHCGTCGKEAAKLVPIGSAPGPDTTIPKFQADTAEAPICNEDDQTPCNMQPEYTELKYFSFLRPRL